MNYEYSIQCSVIRYIKLKYPTLLYTIAPQGFKLPFGVAKKIKAMGYIAGVPDLMIFEPRNGYHGLFIEIKTNKTEYSQKGKVSENQKWWNNELNKRGYKAVICYGYDEVINELENYLK